MITRINESKVLGKQISWKCECKLDDGKCDPNRK